MIRISMKRLRQLDQRGVASLIITMVTMVVISLIVIGFATISRREQRQSLDQQLSAQAFYAAESGIEDAKNVIKSMLAADPNQLIPAKPNCTKDPKNNYPTLAKTRIDDNLNVSYTCLTVDPDPTSLQYNDVSDSSIIARVNTDAAITSLRLTWTPTSAPTILSSKCPNSVDHTLKQQTNWDCGYGLLRADMTPTTGALSRAGLVGDTVTGFFEPTTAASPGTLEYNVSRNTPNFIGAKCATAGPYGTCQATIQNISGNITSMALRLSSLYQPSNVKIEALDNSGKPQKIHGVQATIDSTGKASDVLRRIQVRLPIAAGGLIPGYALQSNGSICKHFSTSSDYFEISGVIAPLDNANAMCLPATDVVIPVCSSVNDVILVLDRSGSMKNEWETGTAMDQLKKVAIKFVKTTQIASDKNHAAIVTFNLTATLGSDLTGDQSALLPVIDALQPQGGTGYTVALDAAAKEFNSPYIRAASPKIIVFVSDGAPHESDPFPKNDTGKTRNDVIAQAAKIRNSGVRIYTIGINGETYATKRDPYDADLLKTMAGTPSQFFDASSEANLDGVMQQISSQLKCNP